MTVIPNYQELVKFDNNFVNLPFDPAGKIAAINVEHKLDDIDTVKRFVQTQPGQRSIKVAQQRDLFASYRILSSLTNLDLEQVLALTSFVPLLLLHKDNS